jgi:hypothetical protein
VNENEIAGFTEGWSDLRREFITRNVPVVNKILRMRNIDTVQKLLPNNQWKGLRTNIEVT